MTFDQTIEKIKEWSGNETAKLLCIMFLGGYKEDFSLFDVRLFPQCISIIYGKNLVFFGKYRDNNYIGHDILKIQTNKYETINDDFILSFEKELKKVKDALLFQKNVERTRNVLQNSSW